MSKKNFRFQCEICVERGEFRAWQKALMKFSNMEWCDELDFYDKWWWAIETVLRTY